MRRWLALTLLVVFSICSAEAAEPFKNVEGSKKDSSPSPMKIAVTRIMVNVLHVRSVFDRNVTASVGVRGFTGSIPPKKAAFCMGVLSADAQFAEQAGDGVMATDILDASVMLLEGQKIRTAIPRKDLKSFSQLQPAIDDYIRRRDLMTHYDLGQWAETMRLALIAAKTARTGEELNAGKILTGPDNMAAEFLELLPPDSLTEGALRGLAYLKTLKGEKEQLGRKDTDQALKALEDIVATARAQLRNKNDWIRAYGEVRDQDDPLVAHVKKTVFPRVWAASRKPQDVISELTVLKSQGDPWTFVLRADGAVIMTQGAIHLCYKDVSKEAGDARLAFLIGHELSHLANRHFWHAEAFNALQSYGSQEQGADQAMSLMFAQVTDAKATTPEAQKAAQVKEAEADQDGLIAAAMAGFDPRAVIAPGGTNFFEAYVSQITEKVALDDKTHPTPQARADFLRISLMPIADALDLFAFGARLYELGRYEDALLLFETFNQRFPGREVLNNIGLCHFQMAQQTLGECNPSLTRRFSVPVQIDTETRAAQFASITIAAKRDSPEKGMEACFEKPEFKRQIAASISRLQLAVEKDPLYLPARINLSSVLIVNREYDKAMSAADEAIRTATEKLNRPGGSPEATNNKALAYYYFGSRQEMGDLKGKAVSLFESLVRQHPEYVEVLYNLGMIRMEMGQKVEGEANLRDFIAKAGSAPLAAEARKKLGMAVATSKPAGAKAAPEPSPVPTGPLDAKGRKQLADIKPKNFTSGNNDIAIYKSRDWKAYVINEDVMVVEKQLPAPVQNGDFLAKYGKPLRTVATAGGEVLIYGRFAVDVKDGKIVRLVFFENI
ncbi:MAG: M48 family metalloprotease [Syntrophales bacterium]|nr:M48 family metalloprotease [Syntrophales bacterium]